MGLIRPRWRINPDREASRFGYIERYPQSPRDQRDEPSALAPPTFTFQQDQPPSSYIWNNSRQGQLAQKVQVKRADDLDPETEKAPL
jgi:hypothetical protein